MTWGQELAAALKQVNIFIQDSEEEELGSKAHRHNVISFGVKIKNALREIWTDHATDVFDIGFVYRLIFISPPSQTSSLARKKMSFALIATLKRLVPSKGLRTRSHQSSISYCLLLMLLRSSCAQKLCVLWDRLSQAIPLSWLRYAIYFTQT